jgi:hypothetical protein
MMRGVLLALCSVTWLVAAAEPVRVLVVRGVDGTEAYGRDFAEQARLWQEAAKRAEAGFEEIGPVAGETCLDQVTKRLEQWIKEKPERLWLVLTGHGTYDGREARFNLTGPDLTPEQLAAVLKPYAGELVFVHTGSASEPFARVLKGERRVLVTATKSGDEVFYTRFGIPFAKAIGGLVQADIDQDGQVSVLEAYLHATAEVRLFYEEEERIATEHALLDDNGDGVGTRSEVYEGTQPKAGAAEPVDGGRARQVVLVPGDEEKRLSQAQRDRRDALETALEKLKAQRGALGEEKYYAALESLLLELAEIVTGRGKAVR